MTYFIAVVSLDMISNVGTIDDLTSEARIILTLPVALLDGLFILWVFTSLSRTLNQVQARRAGAKLELYRFTFCLSEALQRAIGNLISRTAACMICFVKSSSLERRV